MSRILWVCLLFVCFCWNSGVISGQWSTVGNVDNDKAEYKINDTAQTWWDAVRSGCDGYGGNLFTRKYGYWPPEVSSRAGYGIYWVGAVEYSEWKWRDGSRLYHFEGYKRVNLYKFHFLLEGNSVLSCHKKCGELYHWFGLQDKGCYCLHTPPVTYDRNQQTEMRCPGNFNDKCGDNNGMSVYGILDKLTQMPYDSYECGYAKITDYTYPPKLNIHLYPECDSASITKCAMCNNTGHTLTHCNGGDGGGGCVSRRHDSWKTWNKSCPLIKITPNNIKSLIEQTAKSSLYPFYCGSDGYWIGLRKYSERRWIDGRNVNLPNEVFGASGTPKCLTIRTDAYSGSVVPFWTSCLHKHKSLCEVLNPKRTTTTPSTVPITTAPSTPRGKTPSSSHGVTRTVPVRSTSPYQTPHTPGDLVSVPFMVTERQHRGQRKSDKTGIYVGSCVAAAVLLAGIVVAMLFYRQNRLCFKTERDAGRWGDPTAQYNVSTDKATMSVVKSAGYENTSLPVSNTTYNIPVATVKPIYQNVSFKGKQIKKRTGYCNVAPKPPEFGSSSSSGKQQDVSGDGDLVAYESHYEVPVIAAQEHDVNVGNATYDVVGDVVLSGTKGPSDGHAQLDHKVQTLDADDNFIEGKGDSHGKPANANYEVPAQNTNKTDAYDHVGMYPADDLYDTVDRVETGPRHHTNTNYNHISANWRNQLVGAENNNYNTALHRQHRPVQCTDDGYSHAKAFTEDQGTGVEDEGDMDPIYHCIDDCYNEDGERSDKPEEDPGNMHTMEAGSQNDPSYYNIAFTPDNEPDKRKPVKGRDGVYSLAKAISNA